METDVAYIAGLFDGEGNVSIVRNLAYAIRTNSVQIPQYDLIVTIGMNPREAVDKVQEIFGGTIYENECLPGKTYKNIQKSYRWVIDKNISFFLESILPYSIIKKKEIEIALEFCNLTTFSSNSKSDFRRTAILKERLRQKLMGCRGTNLLGRTGRPSKHEHLLPSYLKLESIEEVIDSLPKQGRLSFS